MTHVKSVKYLHSYLYAAKSRAIAIPVDLDSQVNNLFVKSNNVVQKSILNWRLSAKNTSRRDSGLTTSKDYRNIIERLQVSKKQQPFCFYNFNVVNLVFFFHSLCLTLRIIQQDISSNRSVAQWKRQKRTKTKQKIIQNNWQVHLQSHKK